VIRWRGHIKPGQTTNQIFAALDWLPAFVELADGAKGDDLKKQIEADPYPGIVKTTLDGVNEADFLQGNPKVRRKPQRLQFALVPSAAVIEPRPWHQAARSDAVPVTIR
jgi:arylsulfatase A-like enzyme